jgi:putative tricarboxylic transport membrane protein
MSCCWCSTCRSSAFGCARFDFPIAPIVVGLILGPIAESQLRRALSISLGDPLVLVQSPMAATLLGIALIALVAPFVLKGLGRLKKADG